MNSAEGAIHPAARPIASSPHHARVLGAISLDPQRGRIVVPRARSHHCPGHSRELAGKRDICRRGGQLIAKSAGAPLLRSFGLNVCLANNASVLVILRMDKSAKVGPTLAYWIEPES